MLEKEKRVFLRTALMQESITYLLPVPVILSFLLILFGIKGEKLMLISALTGLSAFLTMVAGLALKYYYLRPVLLSLKKIEKGEADPALFARAKKNLFAAPVAESIAILLRWSVSNFLIIMVPLMAMNQLTPVQLWSTESILVLTGFLCMPLYYFAGEVEYARVLDVPQIKNQKTEGLKIIRISIFQKLFLTITAAVGYPFCVLTLIIFLAISKYVNLDNCQAGLAALSVETVIIIVIIVSLLSRNFTRTIRVMSGRFEEIGRGDLTKNLSVITNDEIGALSRGFNAFLEKLNTSIVRVKDSALKLAGSISVVTKASQQMAGSSQSQAVSADKVFTTLQEFTVAMDSIKSGINRLNDWVNATTLSIEGLTRGISSIVRNSRAVIAEIDENIKSANEGKQKISFSVKETIQMNENIIAIAEKVRSVGSETENIDGILKVIRDISERTNILAMNAAIEAAHAGETGKGFAIVASEVRNLAENSSRSAGEIERIIERIKKGVMETVSQTESGRKGFEKGRRMAEESGAALEGIMKSIEGVNRMVAEIGSITEKQGEETRKVLQNAEELKAFSGSIRASVEEQAKSAEQIIRTMNEISGATDANARSSESLSRLAGELKAESDGLNSVVSQFALAKEVKGDDAI